MARLPLNLRQLLGRTAESLAADLLVKKGLHIVARNYRITAGELDLICTDGPVWVFVEVRARSSQKYGGAAWAVPPAKQRQVARVAGHYLVAHKLYGQVDCRFDVVLVNADKTPYEVSHLVDAFRMEVPPC